MADKLVLLQQNLQIHEAKLDAHIEKFNEHLQGDDDRWHKILKVTEENSRNVQALVESTRGAIEAWQAASGAIKVGAAIGRFIKWASGFAIIGAIINYFIDKHPPV